MGFAPIQKEIDDLTKKIIGAAIEVHRRLGPGLLESTYETCLTCELQHHQLKVENQVPIPIVYREITLECGYRLDLIVEDKVIVEVKSVREMLPIHQSQLLSYLKLRGGGIGLLINFNVGTLKEGIRRVQT